MERFGKDFLTFSTDAACQIWTRRLPPEESVEGLYLWKCGMPFNPGEATLENSFITLLSTGWWF